ncbi:iron-containing alcohol dehydrogenase [Bittarella massiliensis (ex Durand et al. 2017)]|uniref:iron-containing alcohol dehydrogenase n=1 Tax=Bittarella massiliensis (ex Durand et al. 2017) TaxID=1720313 RepID=UPI00073F7940|nr:iron-containing alcohol dehydrogenase [Bittarella massiliensis (ex Durand et al. 2017)]
MQNFVYDIPTKVYFGPDQLSHLGEELKKFGTRVLLTYGGGSIKKTGLYDRVVAEIERAGLTFFELSGIEPNPRITSVNKGVALCQEHEIDVLLAVGGGSTIDATKFIGAGYYHDGDAWDLLSDKAPITNCLPIVTVLTLSATGSEMDAGGVISNLETRDKIGRGHPSMRPKVSFLDPTATYTVGPYQTACGAADILSHLMETYFNAEGSLYMLDRMMEGLMETVVHAAPVALAEPENYEARANLMWASSWAINGFTRTCQTCEWSCHPMEHELSAFYDITHGLGLAILTPRWMEHILDEESAPRLARFARSVFGVDAALPDKEAAREGIARLSAFLFDTLGLKSTFTALGIDDTHFAEMAKKACGDGVLRGYRPLRPADVEAIFRACL